MPDFVEPIELCLESLDPAADEQPYVRCVALAGGDPGLGVDADGKIVWCQNELAAALLWVSADSQLILVRRSPSQNVRLIRAERFLDLPLDKPVVVLHEDVITIEGNSFRVHVHGTTRTIAPPERLLLRRAQSLVAGAVLAAAAIAGCHANTTGPSAVSAGATGNEVTSPSATSETGYAKPPPDLGTETGTLTESDTQSQGGTTAASTATMRKPTTKPTPPIQIREHPPAPVRLPND